MREGKLEEAEEIASDAYKRQPDEPEIVHSLASVYRSKAFRSRIYPDDSSAGGKYGKEGIFIIEGKDPKKVFKEQAEYFERNNLKAESLYYKIIRIDSTYLYSYFDLLEHYSLTEDFDSYFKGIYLFIQNLKNDEKTPDHLVGLAGRLIRRKYYEEALKLFNITLKSYPNCTKAESDIGLVYFRQGKIKESIDIYKKVYDKDKKDLINLKNYIYAAVLGEDFKTAYDLYIELINKDKTNYRNYFDAGLLAYLIDKNYKKLFVKYIEVIKNDADFQVNDFFYQSALEFINLENKSEEEQTVFFEFILQQVFKSNLSLLSMITANIIEKIEGTSQSLIIQAAISDRHNFYEKTIEYLGKIKERKKTDNSIVDNYHLNFSYGRANYVAGKFETAREYLLRNFRERKNDAAVNYMLGVCYLESGAIQEARKYFQINANMKDKDQTEYINHSIRTLKNLQKQ
jgi:tetratricopeptide (TPR) repeat protein